MCVSYSLVSSLDRKEMLMSFDFMILVVRRVGTA